MDKMPQPEKKLARAYIPFQFYTTRWKPMEGLKKGTIFPELYGPYMRRKSKQAPDYLPDYPMPKHPSQKWGYDFDDV